MHSRGTSKVPPHFKKIPISPSSSREEGPFTCFFAEGIPAFSLHLKWRRSPLDVREELQGSCHHFKRPPISQCTSDTPDSPEMTRISPRGQTQNMMAGVTALWPLESKTLIPMVNSTGSLTLIFWLERRAELHGSTRDEARVPCGCTRGAPRSMSALEKKPEFLASTPDEDLCISSDFRGILRGPSRLVWRLDLPEASRAGPLGPCCISRKTRRLAHQCELRSFFAAPSREKSHLLS